MSGPTAEFEHALQAIEESYRAGLLAFCAWVVEEWACPDAKAWRQAYTEPYPGEAYRQGYNAALDGLAAALECFLDEL